MKCPKCNGCLEHNWYNEMHYLWCFLCKKSYSVFNGKLTEINLEEEYKRIYGHQ